MTIIAGPNPIVSGESNPYPRLAELRSRAEVVYNPESDMHFILSYRVALAFLREARVSRQAYLDSLLAKFGHSPILDAQKQELAFQDPPRHTEIKRMVMAVFTPARIKSFRPHLQALVQQRLDSLPVDQPVDILAELADPFPAHALSELLGVAPAQREMVYQATADLVHARGVVRTPEQIEAGSRGVAQLSQLFEELCQARRVQPEDDLISALLQAEAQEATRLPHAQLLSVITSLYAASYGNVRNLFGNGLLALLSHPDQLQALGDKPTDLPHAIEEMLRYDSPTQATNPTQLSEPFQGMPAGAHVTLHLGACNRDPEHFVQPDEFRPDRHPNEHLAFSQGAHFCVGAALVRVEAEVMLRLLFERFEVSLTRMSPQWQKLERFRGLKELPVILTPRS